jgi:hypothetical protein
MKKQILFIGTSFLGAIRLGYESISNGSFSATFIGFNAPNLVTHLASGWQISDGHLNLNSDLSCFISGHQISKSGKSISNKTFPGTEKIRGLIFDIRNYDVIVFVDMFYRLCPGFSVNEAKFPNINKVPVSSDLISELKINGHNGWISLDKNLQYGHVPFVNSIGLLTAIKDAAEQASIYLIAAPRWPKGNVDLQARYGDLATARRSFDYLENFYATQLCQQGIEYLPQPMLVLDEDGCLTRPEFSRGDHPTKAGVFDYHMNQQYGEAILAKYAERIFTHG